MEGVKKCLHCMTLHVQAMHNSPTAFSNHRQSTLVSLMRPNLCSIWAPLLVQFWKENIPDTGNFLRYILGNVLADLGPKATGFDSALATETQLSGFRTSSPNSLFPRRASSRARPFPIPDNLAVAKGRSKGCFGPNAEMPLDLDT